MTTISDDPPMLNWIYVDKHTLELKHGNRTQSRPHRVGSWGYINGVDEDEIVHNAGGGVTEGEEGDEDPGGLTFQRKEQFVAVQPHDGEDRWEVRWDQRDNLLEDMEALNGRKVLRISLERAFVEAPKE